MRKFVEEMTNIAHHVKQSTSLLWLGVPASIIFFTVLLTAQITFGASSQVLSTSSLSLIGTGKGFIPGFIPPVAFCFIDEEQPKYSLVPLSVRLKIREYLRVKEHACGSVQTSTATKNVSEVGLPKVEIESQSWRITQWIKDKVSALWNATFDWIWQKVKEKITRTMAT